jgi:protein N-terminal methyltransferase
MAAGSDSNGAEYLTPKEMWEPEIMEQNGTRGWYQKGAAYWEGDDVPPTVDGVLGGYGFVSSIDLETSANFLDALKTLRPNFGSSSAIDCGAGIGRITSGLLMNAFDKVDIVEQSPKFVATARASLSSSASMGEFYCMGLQSFVPEAEKYDAVWIQWVIGQLTDDDFVAFMGRCVSSLKPGGLILLKENISTDEAFVVDKNVCPCVSPPL